MRVKIAHLSDLHLTSSYFVPEWGESTLRLVHELKPDIVIVSGDVTDFGYIFEYEHVEKWFRNFDLENLIVVPGNHDAKNQGYLIFEEIFKTRYPYLVNKSAVVVGIDSSQPDLDDGHIGREKYEFITERLNVDSSKIKIVTLHHHLIPIPGTGRERHIPTDAGDVLKLFCDIGVDFVFSGHKHQPWVWRFENTYYITAGTATTKRLKGKSYPSFNLLEVIDDSVVLKEVNVATGEERLVLEARR